MSSRADVLGALLENFDPAKHGRDAKGRFAFEHLLPGGHIEKRTSKASYTHVVTSSGHPNDSAEQTARDFPGGAGVLSWHGSAPAAAKGAETMRKRGFRKVKVEAINPPPKKKVAEGARADTLGALLEGASTAEVQVRSQAHVGAQLAAEQKKRGSMPGPAAYASSKHPRGAKGTHQGGKFVKAGSSGTPVKEVQKRLGHQQTGKFGYSTVAAVQAYQRAHGLKVDGIVGRQTAQALLGNRNAKVISPGALSAADAKALGISATRGGKAKTTKTRAAKPKPHKVVRIGGGVWI